MATALGAPKANWTFPRGRHNYPQRVTGDSVELVCSVVQDPGCHRPYRFATTAQHRLHISLMLLRSKRGFLLLNKSVSLFNNHTVRNAVY